MYKHATSVADRNFVMLYCESNGKGSKVGFSINKKYGKAVARNRIRRQLKAVVNDIMPTVKDGYNVIFIPRRREKYLFEEVSRSVRALFCKAGLLQ